MSKLRISSLAALLAVTGLAGCGVDGAPRAPEAKPGITLSGEARAGVIYNK